MAGAANSQNRERNEEKTETYLIGVNKPLDRKCFKRLLTVRDNFICQAKVITKDCLLRLEGLVQLSLLALLGIIGYHRLKVVRIAPLPVPALENGSKGNGIRNKFGNAPNAVTLGDAGALSAAW